VIKTASQLRGEVDLTEERFAEFWKLIGETPETFFAALEKAKWTNRQHAQQMLAQVVGLWLSDDPRANQMARKLAVTIGKVARMEVRIADPEDLRYGIDALPKVLPPGWQKMRDQHDGAFFRNAMTGQTIIMSAHLENGDSGRRWLHMSTAFPNRMPTWAELVEAKEIFLGQHSKAVNVIPPRSEYVNINPYVLHLWVCIDEDPLPDFTLGSGSL
jgi:hypothetical protein